MRPNEIAKELVKKGDNYAGSINSGNQQSGASVI
jgi:hypothetical protein